MRSTIKKMLILVTGASRGIGFELVKHLARQKGTLVLAVSRKTSTLEKLVSKENLNNIMPVEADITSAADLDKIRTVIKRLEMPLSGLVNNAGLLVKKKFESIKALDLLQVYTTNVFAPYLLLQKMLPLMNKTRSHVVNISSMGGVQGSSKFPGLSVYSSSKGALCVLTECLAEELKENNISVNCLALGAVDTEMLKAAFPGYRAPLKAGEMAPFVADFLLNGHRFFNGKVLPVSLSTP